MSTKEDENMECEKHKHLVVGGGVCLVTGGITCNACGGDTRFVDEPMIYEGHLDDDGVPAAAFLLVTPRKCEACGQDLIRLADWCGGAYYEVPQYYEVALSDFIVAEKCTTKEKP